MIKGNFIRGLAAGAIMLVISAGILCAAPPNGPAQFGTYGKGDPVSNKYFILLQWKANPIGAPATGFRIYEQEEGSPDWSLLADRPASTDGTNIYTINETVLPLKDHAYSFYITAYNADGENIRNNIGFISFKDESPGRIVFTSYPDMQVPLGKTFFYNADVKTDLEGPISFRLIAAPNGTTIDAATGIVQWTPEGTGTHVITIGASIAGKPLTEAYQSIALYVYEQPEQPKAPLYFTTEPGGLVKIALGEPYSYDADAKSDELSGTITYSLIEAPDGALVDPATGMITWEPTEFGENIFVLRAAMDAEHVETIQKWVVYVYDGNQPIPPSITFTTTPGEDATVGEEYTYAPEVELGGEGEGTLTYKLDYPLDGTIDEETGVVSWTPTKEGYFKMNITVQMMDGDKVIATAFQSWAVHVLPDDDGLVADVKDENLSNSISTYPNPAVNTITVKLEGAKGKADVVMYDMNGTVVYRNSISSTSGPHLFTLDTRSLPTGQYYMQINGSRQLTIPVRITR